MAGNYEEELNLIKKYEDQFKLIEGYADQLKLIHELNGLHRSEVQPNGTQQQNQPQNDEVMQTGTPSYQEQATNDERRSEEMVSNEEMQQHQRDLQDLNDAATALFRIPVFFSHQNLFALGPPVPPFTKQQLFIIRMFKEIKKVLLFPRTLPNTDQYPDTTLENVRTLVNSSYGLATALLVPARPTDAGEPYSPLLQIEPSMGYQRGLPLLMVLENAMVPRVSGIWTGQLAPFTPLIWRSEAPNSVEQFFNSVQWKEALQNWAGQVRSGYFAQTAPEFEYKFNSHD